MIPLSELRPGNRIIGIHADEDKELMEEIEVVCIDPTREITEYEIWVDGTKEQYDGFIPIPLTEEWLKKTNLQSRTITDKDPYYQYSIRNDFEIYCFMDDVGNCLFYGEVYHDNDFFIIKCDTVHIFQNTYAVLNPHKELKIKK